MRVQLTPKVKRLVTSPKSALTVASWDAFIAQCRLGSGQTLEPFAYQEAICRMLCDGSLKSGLVVKSRQLGLTLTTALTMAYQAQTEPGVQLSAVSIRQEDASAIGRRIRKAAGHQLSIVSDNVLELALANGSVVKYLSSGASDPGRGDTNVRGIFLDEAGFYEYRQLLGALAGGTLWANNPWQLAVTTPSYSEHEFYDEFTRNLSAPYEEITGRIIEGSLPPYYCEEPSPGVFRIFVHFTAVPRFRADPNLYLGILLNSGMSPQHVEREANLVWSNQSTSAVFDSAKLARVTHAPYKGELSGDILVGVDPAGFGRDKFAIVFARANPVTGHIQILAERSWGSYDGSAITAELEQMLAKCPSGTITIEGNGVGAGFVDLLLEDSRFARFDCKLLTTTRTTKARAVAFVEWLISSERIAFYSPNLPTQLRRWVMDKTNKAARGGDDLVMGLFIGFSALDNLSGYADWYRRFWLPGVGSK